MRYQILGNTGLRVSELCLGTMSFGDKWGFGADEKTSHQVLDAYRAGGGNFLDTANKYHNGQTEEILGRWLEAKRHEMVVATKYTLAMNQDDPNTAGSHRKNLIRSVDESLKRLRTDYIDLLWVHAWDAMTPFEETMRALDDIVRSGKVLYVGMSDAPAWIMSASQVTAELRAWSKLAGIQVEYSLLERSGERDLLPMAEHFGLSFLAWGPLSAGVLTGKHTRGKEVDSLRTGANELRGRLTERSLNIARAVDAVADEIGASSAQVALAWVRAQGKKNIPIVGARKVSQIEDTMAAGAISLDETAMSALNEASSISLGFPHAFLGEEHVLDMVYSNRRSRIDSTLAGPHNKG